MSASSDSGRERALRLARHLFVDGWGCPPAVLDDPVELEAALRRAVKDSGATLIELCVHQFSPQGVTATATLAESHLAIHTWPEHGYFAADLLFCGQLDPHRGVPAIVESLRPTRYRVHEIPRGIALPPADGNRPVGEDDAQRARTKDDGGTP